MTSSVVCITGASQGIGRGIADYFTELGHWVFNLDVKPSPDSSEALKSLYLDITDYEA